jgi:hypothetical protein
MCEENAMYIGSFGGGFMFGGDIKKDPASRGEWVIIRSK